VSLSESERIRLRACGAVLTSNRRELEWASAQSPEVLGDDLTHEIAASLAGAPVPGESRLVRATTLLPAWVQYAGQRAVLLFPRLARRLLRGTGLHNQMF